MSGGAVQLEHFGWTAERESFSASTLGQGLGIEILGRRSVVLIPAGTTLPTEHERPFTTVADAQRAVEVRVVCCARGGKPCGLLGRFLLAGFRPGPRGAVRIDIGLSLDTAGIVRAWARDRETGAREECVFAATERRWPLAALTGEVEARKRSRGAAAVVVLARKYAEYRAGVDTEGGEGV